MAKLEELAVNFYGVTQLINVKLKIVVILSV